MLSSFRLLAPVILCLAATSMSAQDDGAPDVVRDVNTVCGPKVSAGRFSVKDVAPGIVGAWTGTAPGIGMTKGVQEFTVYITFENGRLYMAGDGGKTELKPVYGMRKPLRFDPIRQTALPQEAWATPISSDDVALVAGCEEKMAPQFTWTVGMAGRSSGGIYSFFGPNLGLGTMWNSAQGAREVLLQR